MNKINQFLIKNSPVDAEERGKLYRVSVFVSNPEKLREKTGNRPLDHYPKVVSSALSSKATFLRSVLVLGGSFGVPLVPVLKITKKDVVNFSNF